MKKLLVIGGILACVALAWAASTGRRISDVLHVTVFHPSDLMVAARTNSTPETNVFATWAELSNSIAANVLLSANTNTFDASNFLFGVLGTNTTVAAGVGATVGTNIVGNQRIYTVGVTANFDSITVTNAVNRIRSLVPSTTLTTQIDFSTGPTAYYWTNMVTNITLQITNVWAGSVSNRVLDFFFTGATNNGPNYTVIFSCPNPSGLVFRWGTYSATNGANAFAVTNNSGAGVSLTLWDTNLIEAYYSPTR